MNKSLKNVGRFLVKMIKCMNNYKEKRTFFWSKLHNLTRVQKSIMSTCADGEFWSKKSTISSDMVADVATLTFIGFTFSDFNLNKEWSLTLNKLGTKERA